MDFSDSTKVVVNRIKKLDPENVTKIIGYLLLQDHGEREMLRLSMYPDALFQQVIYKAKAELKQLAQKTVSSPISPTMNPTPFPESPLPFAAFSPISSQSSLCPENFRVLSTYWDHELASKHHSGFTPPPPPGYSDSICELQNQTQFLSLEDQIESANSGISGISSDYYCSDATLGNINVRTGRRLSSLPEFPVKICHYFNRGFCKHGSNCRYFHGQLTQECFSHRYCPNLNDAAINEDHIISHGPLEKLELEIIEILKSRRGNPVSIASLPMIYYEKYGKVLQADGYLTESQRHGKAGYSLTKLLARLKNSIRLIDRPHGQHALILAEDAPNYVENRSDRIEPGPIVSGSRQIYLTFPAESTFSEDDVSNYFNTFGVVEDVRIPCQQKRMFGFVTFVSADTAKMILAMGNPHYVCEARVLVKPYREKSKIVDRKYMERIEHPAYYSSYCADADLELPPRYETSRLLRKQLIEEEEHALELERRHHAGLQLAWKPMATHPYFSYAMDGVQVSEDNLNFSLTEHYNYLLDVLNSSSSSDEKIKQTDNSHSDRESNQLNLPDSPFASAISTVT